MELEGKNGVNWWQEENQENFLGLKLSHHLGIGPSKVLGVGKFKLELFLWGPPFPNQGFGVFPTTYWAHTGWGEKQAFWAKRGKGH